MQFDPYHTWLGIPPDEQPPNHYRLLGLREYEASGDVIAHAADRQMTYVRTLQSGKYGEFSQQILNEIAAARVCLLNAEKKAEYDAQLKARQRPAASVVEPPARIVPPPVPHSGRVHESQVQSRPPIPPPSGRGERRGQEQPLPGPPRVPSRQTGEVPLAGPGEAAYSATTEPPGASPSAGTGQHAHGRPGGSSSQYNVLPGAAARSHAGPPPVPVSVPVGASHSAAQDRDNAFAPSEPGNEYSQFSMPADSALAAAEILGAAGSRPLPFGQSAAPGYVSSADGLEKLRLPVEQAPQAANSSTSPRNKKSRWWPLALIGGGLALALAALLAAGIAAAVLMNRSDGKPSADIADATRGDVVDLAAPAKDTSAGGAEGDNTAGEQSGTSGEGGAASIAADGSVFEADPPIAAAAVENGTAETTQTPGSESVVVSADDPFSVPAPSVDVAVAGAGSTDGGAGATSGTAAGGAESSTLAATNGPVLPASEATSSTGKSAGTRANPPDKVTATTRPPAEPSVERPVSPLGIGAIYSGPKHAVPSGAEARKANELKRELMREADKINARDLKARLLHAEELLRRGQSEKDPVKQYATLEIAYDRALKLNLYPLAKQALRDITTRYDVDELQRRIDFVKQLARKARNPVELNALAIDTMQLADEALDAEKFDEAEALCGMAKDLAEKAGNAAKMREARQKQSHVGEARRAATLRRAKPKKKAAKKRR